MERDPNSAGDRGSVLLECAIIFAVLAALLTSAFDCGRIIQRYLLLSQVSYEGARAASFVAGLSQNTSVLRLPDTEERLTCMEELSDPGIDPPLPCALFLANLRMAHLLEICGASNLSGLEIASSYDGAGHVTARLSMEPDAFFPLFRLFRIEANTKLPYIVPAKRAGGNK